PLVTRSLDGTVRVWRVDGTGGPVVLRGHEGRVERAAFSADGQRVLTASEDGTARVWRADGTGEPVVLGGHEGKVRFTDFSPDGERVLSVSEDGTVCLWTVGTVRLQALLREAATGCLTPEQRQRYLLETPEEARAGHERCERERGGLPPG
ncbi:WD40 repeat domain-containing protein, partial [Archangium sp.]|uniref:WD40 repeat domain-containing protein n=1 Tax=Archangium sp. TaxID=1872627 RepID=UPI002D6C5EB0|nr:serine/threonine protein kinase [Archangium sp.]